MNYDKDEIKQSLTIDQVFNLVEYLGGDPQMRDGYFISHTICHNPPHEGSFKLYYYNNTQLFHCFTSCTDTFDIFELIIKIKQINLNEAIKFIVNYFQLFIEEDNILNEDTKVLEDWDYFDRHQEDIQNNIVLKEYNNNILKFLPQPRIIEWENEGISADIIKHHDICYDPKNEGIVIPHFDINNRLIGIRERTLIQEEEKNGKYKPAILNGVIYNHALSLNLYNLNNSKNNIKIIKKAIIFESEKATMQYASYFGEDSDISVAVCGNNLTQYQVNLLLQLGVKEIIIAFDKQFKELNDKEHKQWCKKLYNIYNKFKQLIQISFIFDKEELLDYKMSPIDNGKDIFLQLYERRIYL